MTPRKRGTFLAAVMLTLATGAGVAHAASDDPTPYTVTAQGITLPEGTTFPANGHVNWRTTWAAHGIHFDPNNGHPGAKYIGASFIPFNLEPGECVTWVQVSLYDEHYGEGGQDPICKPTTTPTEEPTWTPEPTPSPSEPEPPSETQTPPSPEPSEPPTTPPTPGPEPTTPTPSPTTPTTQPPQPSEQPSEPGSTPEQPSTTPDPTDTPTTPTPIQPGENPWPTNRPARPVDATPVTTPTDGTSDSRPTADEPSSTSGPASPTEPSPSLAVTGSNDPLIGVVAFLACVLLGAYLYLTNHRRKP